MAITITPTRTGMDVGLADIAVILSEQNQVLAETAIAQQKLTDSFSSYLKILKGDQMDELQDERRAKTESNSGGMSMAGLAGMKPSFTGIMDYLKTFAKRLIPVALGILFGDDLIEGIKTQIEKMTGEEISDNIVNSIMTITGGTLLGFLFGGFKGGFLGLILTAFTSEFARQKIADTFNNILGTDIENSDWQAWTTGIVGTLGVLWGPTLIGAAFKRYFASSAGEKTKRDFGRKLVGDIFKNQKFLGALRFGLQGLLIGAIGYLAIQGGQALIDYFRDKNKQMFRDAINESEPYLEEYKRTGDVAVLQKGMDAIGKTQTEARRMMEIGQASGAYDEAALQYEKTSLALGAARGEDGQIQREVKEAQALRGGLQSALNYAMKRAMEIGKGNPNQGDFLQAALELGSSKGIGQGSDEVQSAFKGAGIYETIDTLMQRSQMGVSQQAREAMNKYGARSTNAAPVVMDNSLTDASTNISNSSPMVLPNGGAGDFSDNKSKMFISGL